jgi:hypothetical protein
MEALWERAGADFGTGVCRGLLLISPATPPIAGGRSRPYRARAHHPAGFACALPLGVAARLLASAPGRRAALPEPCAEAMS